MSLAQDLLRQAEQLAGLDSGRPRQANLRRAISAAYYALFHLLIAESVQRVSPRSPGNLAPRIARSFAHSEMKQVCRAISEQHRSAIFFELQPNGFSPELRLVAQAFVQLQDQRHRADYDLAATFARPEVADVLDMARSAFEAGRKVRSADEANVFLAALLFSVGWSK